MAIMYKTRTDGATVTIKVPFDCQNHCPFCINKREYSDTSKFDIDKIIKQIKVMGRITPNCDFVFTGGEPMADLDKLGRMIKAIPSSHKIFINTTFPLRTRFDGIDIYNEEAIESYQGFIVRYSGITGFNVSRHIDQQFDGPVLSDQHLCELKRLTSIRINCVMYKETQTRQQILDAATRWATAGFNVQFRKDYMTTTIDNLYKKDHIQEILDDLFELYYATGCRMRCGYFYATKINNSMVSYHKTLPYSLIKEPCGLFIYNIIYDIVINQDGSIDADWDGTPLDIESYKKVTFEDEPSRDDAMMKEIETSEHHGLEFYNLIDKIETPEAIEAFLKKNFIKDREPEATMRVDDHHIIDEYRYDDSLVYVHYAEGEGVFRVCSYSVDSHPVSWMVDWKKGQSGK